MSFTQRNGLQQAKLIDNFAEIYREMEHAEQNMADA